MRLLILHRVTDKMIRYASGINHEAHDVTYVGPADRLTTLPADLCCTRIERPGTGDTATEVLAAVAGLPPFDLVISLAEFDLIAAAQVRTALGVPGDQEADILPWRDKVVMKSAVATAGLRVPRFLPLSEALDAEHDELPWANETVLKPLDGAASLNVHVYPTLADALAVVREAGLPEGTEQNGFEVEEFITGSIIHVDGLVVDGKLTVVKASRYIGTCLGYADGTPLGSVQIDLTPELNQWATECLAAVGITTSLFHLEGIETADGPVFLEVGARFGGADVVDTFELATGVHLPSRYLQLITDGLDTGSYTWPDVDEPHYGWFIWPGHRLGSEFCRIEGERAFRENPLVHRWIQRSESDPVKTTLSYVDTDIPLAGIVGPASSAELDRFLREAFSSICVEPSTPPGGGANENQA